MHDGHDHHAGGGHLHDHAHMHSHENHMASTESEAVALLTYMISHNEHHAEELSELAHSLRHLDKDEAAEEMEAGVLAFQEGNERLRVALALLQQ